MSLEDRGVSLQFSKAHADPVSLLSLLVPLDVEWSVVSPEPRLPATMTSAMLVIEQGCKQ